MLIVNSDETLLPIMSDPKDTEGVTIWGVTYVATERSSCGFITYTLLMGLMLERYRSTESATAPVRASNGFWTTTRAIRRLCVSLLLRNVTLRLNEAASLAARDERVHSLVDVLDTVGGRQLDTDPGLALRHDLFRDTSDE
jgi:hypothetical protein